MKVTITQRKLDGSLTKVVIKGVIIETEGDDVDEMMVRAEENFNLHANGKNNSILQNGVYRMWIEEG